jgi:hypothetical protein
MQVNRLGLPHCADFDGINARGTLVSCTQMSDPMKLIGIKQARQGEPVAKLIAGPRSARELPSLTRFRQSLGGNGTQATDLVRKERDAR